MAQEMTGLFGPTEREIRSAIDEKGRADTQTLFAGAPRPLMLAASELANAGRNFGSMFESLGGYVDPRVEKARKMEMVKQQVLSSGISPADNPAEFARVSAQYLAKAGLADEAYGAAMYARQMEQETEKQAWEQEKFDKEWASRAQIARMQGEFGNEQARIMAAARASGSGDPKLRDYNATEVEKDTEMYFNRMLNDKEFAKKFGYNDWSPFNQDKAGLTQLARQMALAKQDQLRMNMAAGPAEEEVYNRFTRKGDGKGGKGDKSTAGGEEAWFVAWLGKPENQGKSPEQACKEYEAATGRACSMREVVPNKGKASATSGASITGPVDESASTVPAPKVYPTERALQRQAASKSKGLADQDPRVVAYRLLQERDRNEKAWRAYKNAANPQAMAAEIDDYKKRVRAALDALEQDMTPKQRAELRAIVETDFLGGGGFIRRGQ